VAGSDGKEEVSVMIWRRKEVKFERGEIKGGALVILGNSEKHALFENSLPCCVQYLFLKKFKRSKKKDLWAVNRTIKSFNQFSQLISYKGPMVSLGFLALS
jgi:hypothetical protein